MTAKTKTFLVQILSDTNTFMQPHINAIEQGMRIMDVPGYSHMLTRESHHYAAGITYATRYVVFLRTNKANLHRDVKKALGYYYWPSISDFIYEYGNEPYYT